MKGAVRTRRGVVVIDPNGVIRFRKVCTGLPSSDDEVIDAIRHAQKTEF